MDRLSILCESPGWSEDIRRQLARVFEIRWYDFDSIHCANPDRYTIVDVNLQEITRLRALRAWLKRKPKGAATIIVTNKTSHLENVRAHAIGATDIVHRPIDGKVLLSKLWGDLTSFAGTPSDVKFEKSEAITASLGALQDIFSSACLGGRLNPAKINEASRPIIHHIEEEGLASWIETVRKHHSQTYQHSLLVTGIAVSFGQRLGLSKTDRERLSFAGMLHDIGKARIPLAILEKPSPLDKQEIAIMRQHPQLGLDSLGTVAGIHKEMTDMVLHHHEYLDGSGYPHGLQANEISDLVRMMTISDVFAALIERRTYKHPLPAEAAYQILLDMGPKLDKDLVREFSFVSQLNLEEK
jgi:putative nucleotidyltransferase with HDIG domain